ncbi:hypothetical protein AVEN_831-1 [Araneus ventricosus]|uniref:Histone-lysine N-methyltransferase SETMAR n=1 Tax=Araneus ventricosus TaxID=182803 RepID=A0A4Y2GDB2_ARAVE|nr:hypothetical protein AVEN_831-1 [Araneus ventricosus]
MLYSSADSSLSQVFTAFKQKIARKFPPLNPYSPPYNPDLAPSDFHLFLKLKEFFGGKRFGSDEELENAVTTWLNELAAEEHDMGIVKLVDRYDKYLNVGGDYVEKGRKLPTRKNTFFLFNNTGSLRMSYSFTVQESSLKGERQHHLPDKCICYILALRFRKIRPDVESGSEFSCLLGRPRFRKTTDF